MRAEALIKLVAAQHCGLPRLDALSTHWEASGNSKRVCSLKANAGMLLGRLRSPMQICAQEAADVFLHFADICHEGLNLPEGSQYSVTFFSGTRLFERVALSFSCGHQEDMSAEGCW